MTTDQLTRTVDALSIGIPKHWGALTLFPLYRHDPVSVDVLPASLALESGRLHISESAHATVPTLLAKNDTGTTVLFVAGEMVFGGKQDRMLTDSLLISPGEWDVPVACVESGRWSGDAHFDRRTGLGPRQVRQGPIVGRGHRGVSQGVVWESVEQTLHDADTPHATQSLRAALDRSTNGAAQLGPLPGQCGVAIGKGQRVIGVELFADHRALASYWSSIIGSYALDNVRAYEGRPSLGAVLRFIRKAAAELEPIASAGPGRQLRHATHSRAGTALLTVETLIDPGTLVHLAVLAG